MEADYIRMGDMRRPTPSHSLNAYCTVIVRVSYGYGYTRGSGRVWVEIFGTGRVRVRVASSAAGTGRVAEMVDPHTPTGHHCASLQVPLRYFTVGYGPGYMATRLYVVVASERSDRLNRALSL